MNDDKRKEMKVLVAQRIEETIEQLKGYADMAEPITPENAIGRVSRMDAINNKSVVDAAIQTAKIKLSGLRHMLQHIDDEDFGKCERCGRDIPEQRMILMPESKRCTPCASR